ncbi:MAG TPA: hypothetical protein VES03_00285 [Motilibacterales bacterium]|nr:hypothetical protein [Motilibacterales bacterium]
MRLYPQLAVPRNRQILRDVLVLGSLALFALFAWAVKEAVMTLTAISAGFTDNAQGVQDSWDSIGGTLSGIPFVGDDVQGAVSDLSDATVGSAVQAGEAITEAVTTTANVLAFVTFAAPAAVLLVLYLPRRLDRARAWTAADQVLSAIEVNPAFGLAGSAPRSISGAGTAAIPEAEGGPHDTIALPWGPGQGRGAGPAPGAGVPGSGPALGALRPGLAVVAFPPDELLALRALCDLPFVDLVRYTPRPFEAFYAGDYAPLIRALYAHEGLEPPV